MERKSFFEKFYPDYIFDKVEDIPYELIRKEDIHLILMDMDNTIIDKKNNYTKELRNWIKEMKSKGIRLYIVSNSYSTEKVKKLSKELGIKYLHKAWKPSRKGLRTVFDSFKDIKKEQTLMIGDQIFTDILAGNRFNIKTILVNRRNEKESILSSWKRPLEKIILKKYYNKESEG